MRPRPSFETATRCPLADVQGCPCSEKDLFHHLMADHARTSERLFGRMPESQLQIWSQAVAALQSPSGYRGTAGTIARILADHRALDRGRIKRDAIRHRDLADLAER